MFAIHGFDPKSLTDDQLFEKQLDLTRKRLMAARFGKVDVTDQLQMMIQAIEFERRERMFNSVIGNYMLKSASVVVETDPDLKEKDLQTEEEEHPQLPVKQSSRTIRRPIRSATPIKTDGSTT